MGCSSCRKAQEALNAKVAAVKRAKELAKNPIPLVPVKTPRQLRIEARGLRIAARNARIIAEREKK